MKWVIDASVAVKWYIQENWNEEADFILCQSSILTAPDFLLVESANIFWKKVIKQELTCEESQINLNLLYQSIDRFVSSQLLYSQSLQLAFEVNHSIYDMMYLSTALITDSIVITADRRFFDCVNNSPYHHQIHWIGNPLPDMNINKQ